MKNASQIITSIQYKPQLKKVLYYKHISNPISIILPSIQNSIINTIKMVLNAKSILEKKDLHDT